MHLRVIICYYKTLNFTDIGIFNIMCCSNLDDIKKVNWGDVLPNLRDANISSKMSNPGKSDSLH